MGLFGKDRGISRRSFTIGAALSGAGIAASAALSGCKKHPDEKPTSGEPQVVKDESQIVNVYDEYDAKDMGYKPAASWMLPLGTVLFHSEGERAAAMMTPEDPLHPNALGVLNLTNGKLATLIQDPASGRGYSFYDVRCSNGLFAWVEIDYVTREWSLWAQPFSDGSLAGEQVKLDGGDENWEPCTFAVTASSVVWLKMPQASGKKSSSDSHCMMWSVGDAEGHSLLTSHGRFATPPRISSGVLTVVPRVNENEGTYYGLTALSLEGSGGARIDQLVLPSPVKPFDAVYTGEVFVFSIEAAYQSVGSLGNMGTFIGREGGPYVYVGREPAAQVSFNGSRYFIKSQSSHAVVDTRAHQTGAIWSPDRCLGFGDFPASEGQTTSFLTYATVRDAKGIPQGVMARVFAI
ncbi:MAG: hypothetical protein Q4B30_02315 [Coriobacteriaceae bacterium]|nr:hypothetical protein [Coriobacteriaceae bacterium]